MSRRYPSIQDLELKVVQAAIQLRDIHRINASVMAGQAAAHLLDAVDELIFGCSECNAGGHTCPGDGKSINHGQGDCGEHEEDEGRMLTPPGMEASAFIETMRTAQEWISTQWRYVLPGDHVRLGTTEADVVRCWVGQWHTHQEEYYNRNGELRDKITPWEHEEAGVTLAHLPDKRLTFPPEGAVAVLMDETRQAQHLLARELGATKE